MTGGRLQPKDDKTQGSASKKRAEQVAQDPSVGGEERAEDPQVEDSDADAVASRLIDTDPGGHGMG